MCLAERRQGHHSLDTGSSLFWCHRPARPEPRLRGQVALEGLFASLTRSHTGGRENRLHVVLFRGRSTVPGLPIRVRDYLLIMMACEFVHQRKSFLHGTHPAECGSADFAEYSQGRVPIDCAHAKAHGHARSDQLSDRIANSANDLLSEECITALRVTSAVWFVARSR